MAAVAREGAGGHEYVQGKSSGAVTVSPLAVVVGVDECPSGMGKGDSHRDRCFYSWKMEKSAVSHRRSFLPHGYPLVIAVAVDDGPSHTQTRSSVDPSSTPLPGFDCVLFTLI